jgi:hypothetical protein
MRKQASIWASLAESAGRLSCSGFVALIGVALAAGFAAVAETNSAPVPGIRRLPVTTGWLGNTLLRGGAADWSDSSQTYLQLYTSDLAVTPEGFVFCTTPWEEGGRAAGVYRDGDALPEIPSLGINSGAAVAASGHWLAYGRNGRVALFVRSPGTTHQPASGRELVFDSRPDAPLVIGVGLDEPRDRLYAADETGTIRSFQLSTGKVLPGVGFQVARAGPLRVDADGNLWVLRPATTGALRRLEARGFASESVPGRGVDGALAPAGATNWFEARAEDGFCGIEFDQPTAVQVLRFSGAGFTTFVGANLQASANGRGGPWTNLVAFRHEPRGWPETVLTLDGRPWRALRVAGSRLGLNGLAAFGREPASSGAVTKFSPDGKLLASIETVAEPLALALDPARDRLLVADNSAAQQIVAFTGLAGTPRLDVSFGVQGRFGRPGGLPGAGGSLGEPRFDTVRGLGVDGAGNLHVFSVGGTGMSQSRLECFSPAGELRWRMGGLAFLDSAELDPADPQAAWSCTARYRRDPAGRLGDGWGLVATTVDRFRFPEDPRLNGGGAQILGIRRLGGRPFLFTTTQYGTPVSVFRFEDDSSTAIPCAYLAGIRTGREWPPGQPPGAGLTLWRDADGDGRFRAEEFEKDADLCPGPLTLDAAGNLWLLVEGKAIRRIDAGQPDARGTPRWSLGPEGGKSFAWPPPFAGAGASIRGLEVAPDGRALFAFGFTPEFPSVIGHNLPLGRLLVRYAIGTAGLTETHRTVLPYDVNLQDAPGDQAYASSVAGDYLFVGYEQRMTVLVYRAATLEIVGRVDLGPQSQTPIFDGPPELIAAQRGDTYELFFPQYTGNATSVLTWRPADVGWVPAPERFRAVPGPEATLLEWTAPPTVTGWKIQRRTLAAAGWSTWQDLTNGTGAAKSWRDLSAPKAGAGYRLRVAVGGAESDWSKTAYVRP